MLCPFAQGLKLFLLWPAVKASGTCWVCFLVTGRWESVSDWGPFSNLTNFTEWSYIFNTYQNGEANFCGDLALMMGTFWRCQFEGQIIVFRVPI